MVTKSILYNKRMVAFLDILGFERIVDKSRNDTEIIQKLANMLMSSKRIALSILQSKLTVLKVDPTQYVYRAFSDTSVITGPYISHDDLVFLSTWIMYYQYHLWKEEKSFLRGAIVYGDIYHDEDVMFGPAIVDAYHLERDAGKAVWPRVLIDGSLLDKVSKPERRRDFFEFLRRDDNSIVYLDYLRELFHIIVLAANKKITGERERDFGAPIELFEDHKAAILAQVDNALKEENKDRIKKIISKYVELSKYNNAVINTLCQVIAKLLKNRVIISEVFNDMLKLDSYKHLGHKYTPKYSAEDHPEQADMLDILGTISNTIIENHIGDDASLEEAFHTLHIEAPKELSKLEQSLNKSKIDLDSLPVHL